jgi:hypothetical protein
VTDDYYGTSQQGAPYSAPAPTAVAGSNSSPVAALIAVAGVVMCLGAVGPWLHASAYGQSFSYSGMHSQLDGRWVFALGVVVAALGLTLAVSQVASEARAAICAVCVVIGVVGLVVVIHQHDRLSVGVGFANAILGSFLPIKVGMGWGLWLSGFGCVGASVTAGLAYLL